MRRVPVSCFIFLLLSAHIQKKGKQTPRTPLPAFLSWDWERVKREVLIRGCYPWSLKINLWSYYLSGLLQVPKGLLRKDQNRRARALRVKHKKEQKKKKRNVKAKSIPGDSAVQSLYYSDDKLEADRSNNVTEKPDLFMKCVLIRKCTFISCHP